MQEGDTVRVVDAPGYEDFTATLLMVWEDWPYAAVSMDDVTGLDGVTVVPASCIHPVTEVTP